jgi:ribosomal protein L18
MAKKFDKVAITSVIIKQFEKQFTDKVKKAAKTGALLAARHLQRASQKVVPIDTGHLKKSCQIIDESTPDMARYVVTYSAQYAIYVHENLTATHAAGKQAKYLEEPARNERDYMNTIIVTEIGKALK